MLIEHLLYNDLDLVKDALKLLNRMFTQRHQLLMITKDIQIIEDQLTFNIIDKIDELFIELKLYAENTEFWLGYEDSESKLRAA